MALFVRFWGTRGSIPTPGQRTQRFGGNTSCVEVRTNDQLFICDGGTGLRELGVDLMRRFPPGNGNALTGHMFFSHPHWDHIQGFPFFSPAYVPANTFYVYGAAKGDRKMYDLLSGQMESAYFPVDFADLGGTIISKDFEKDVAQIDGVKVRIFRQFHPGGSLGFSFEHRGRKVVYATDNEIDQTLLNKDDADKKPDLLRKPPEDLLAFVKDADLLIADGQYTDEEYPKKVGWGHPRATTVVDLAIQAGVRQLALYHHDPMHSDREVDALIDLCNARAERHKAQLVVFGAREGLELKIA